MFSWGRYSNGRERRTGVAFPGFDVALRRTRSAAPLVRFVSFLPLEFVDVSFLSIIPGSAFERKEGAGGDPIPNFPNFTAIRRKRAPIVEKKIID